jgi:predicted nucleotidyltransferase
MAGMADGQIELLLKIVCDVLDEDVTGAYLYGSAVLGGLRPQQARSYADHIVAEVAVLPVLDPG